MERLSRRDFRRPPSRPVTVEEAAKAPKNKSRAGRNLPAAIGMGILLVTVLVLSMVIHPVGFLVLTIAGSLVALSELRSAFARANVDIAYPISAVGAIGILVSAYQLGMEAAFVSFYAALGAGVVWHLVSGNSARQTIRNIAVSAFALGYVPLLASFALLILVRGGIIPEILFVLITVMNDTGGYIAGVLFGKHPMAPSISPKKSWEGFAGSLLGTLLAGISGMIFLGAHWWWGIILGLLCAVTATSGDLAESLLKRDLGLKDMGNILPGHGGIMDRLDSLLVTAPACFLVMHIALGW
ncbi:phosphatidate cytidylyltransferase [Actinomycetaceae bacterium TAE3-ERU4]|nr:phosphatidate cytidylyltransferase [Actinomycetaceae bacterium TAE3-ERU4]